MPVPLGGPPRHEVVVVPSPDLREILGEGHPAIDHHRRAAAPAGPLLQRRQHLVHGGAILAIAIEDLVGLRKPVAVQDQPHNHLLAVGPVIARVAALGLRILRALAFKVGGRQVVEVDRVVQVEQRALARGQGLLDRRALRMQPIEIAIERLVTERAEVRPENVAERGAPDPVRHGVLRGRAHQAIERHDLTEPPRPRTQPGLGQDRVERERLPQLMANMDRARFADILDADRVGVNREPVASRRLGAGPTPRRARAGHERGDGGIGHERRLAAQGGGEFVRQAPPLLGGGGRERAERTDRAVARSLRGGDGLDEEMIDVGLGPDTPARALDEHAGPISLLPPPICQEKSSHELVTILSIPEPAPRHFRELHRAAPRTSPFARCGPWKLG